MDMLEARYQDRTEQEEQMLLFHYLHRSPEAFDSSYARAERVRAERPGAERGEGGGNGRNNYQRMRRSLELSARRYIRDRRRMEREESMRQAL